MESSDDICLVSCGSIMEEVVAVLVSRGGVHLQRWEKRRCWRITNCICMCAHSVNVVLKTTGDTNKTSYTLHTFILSSSSILSIVPAVAALFRRLLSPADWPSSVSGMWQMTGDEQIIYNKLAYQKTVAFYPYSKFEIKP